MHRRYELRASGSMLRMALIAHESLGSCSNRRFCNGSIRHERSAILSDLHAINPGLCGNLFCLFCEHLLMFLTERIQYRACMNLLTLAATMFLWKFCWVYNSVSCCKVPFDCICLELTIYDSIAGKNLRIANAIIVDFHKHIVEAMEYAHTFFPRRILYCSLDC